MNNIYVLDTSVLIANPYAIRDFKDCKIIIPITILEELDKLKKQSSEVGRNARLAIKYLDELTNQGDITAGINLQGSIVQIVICEELDSNSYGDNNILKVARQVKETSGNDVVLISNDINLRVRAKAAGLLAEGYEDSKTNTELYSGFQIVKDPKLGKNLLEHKVIRYNDKKVELYENEFILYADRDGSGVATGRRVGEEIRLVSDVSPWGLKLRGKEQLFAANLIMDPNVPLVSIAGIAGGGKTLVALGCALELVLNQRKYSNLTIYRPIQTVGEELGYLPGSVEEKISPFYGPIEDAFSLLFSDRSSRNKDAWKTALHQYMDAGIIKQEAIAFIRGRSIHNSLVLIDEAQNLSKEEVKTIITRVGENSKIIFTGDIEQIDTRSLDAVNNGLTYLIEKFKEHDVAGHILLSKGERSKLSSLAAQIL